MATVEINSKSGGKYRVEQNLAAFLEGFGLQVDSMVKAIPGNLPNFGHADLSNPRAYVNMYGKGMDGDTMYIMYMAKGAPQPYIFRLSNNQIPSIMNPNEQAAPAAPATTGTATQMTPEQQQTATEVKEKLTAIFTAAGSLFPGIKAACTAAHTALTGIKEIVNDEQDAKANALLTKVRTTFDKRTEERKQITGPLDELKAYLMGPEKLISTDEKQKDSEYNRVKGLRLGYANQKLAAANLAKAQAAAAQAKATEENRIKAELLKSVANGIFAQVQVVTTWITGNWPKLNLDNIDGFLQRITVEPRLKEEVYNGFFNVAYNTALIKREEYDAIVAAVKMEKTWDVCNAEYVTPAKAAMKVWADQVPAHKKSLQTAANAAPEQQQAVAQAAEAQAATIAQEQQATLQAAQETQVAAIEEQQGAADMAAAFSAQVATQSIEDPDGIKFKIATITSPEEEIVVTMSELFYQVFTHPKYEGIIKRDKHKALVHDETGRPVYVDWVESLLKFYAANCQPTVKGITLTEAIRVVNKV